MKIQKKHNHDKRKKNKIRTYPGCNVKNMIKIIAFCSVNEEICNGANKYKDWGNDNGEKQLKGEDGVYLTYEEPS